MVKFAQISECGDAFCEFSFSSGVRLQVEPVSPPAKPNESPAPDRETKPLTSPPPLQKPGPEHKPSCPPQTDPDRKFPTCGVSKHIPSGETSGRFSLLA